MSDVSEEMEATQTDWIEKRVSRDWRLHAHNTCTRMRFCFINSIFLYGVKVYKRLSVRGGLGVFLCICLHACTCMCLCPCLPECVCVCLLVFASVCLI